MRYVHFTSIGHQLIAIPSAISTLTIQRSTLITSAQLPTHTQAPTLFCRPATLVLELCATLLRVRSEHSHNLLRRSPKPTPSARSSPSQPGNPPPPGEEFAPRFSKLYLQSRALTCAPCQHNSERYAAHCRTRTTAVTRPDTLMDSF